MVKCKSYHIIMPTIEAKLTLAGGGDFFNPGHIVDGLGVSEGMRVADFGCGSGHFTIIFAKKVGKDGRVVALDIQEPPLETVREKAKAEGFSNIETIRGNLEVVGGSSLPEGSQDMVFMANILFQNDKKGDVVKEGKRVLKDNGRMVLIEWKKGAGGFGPPESLRTGAEELKSTVLAEGLAFEKDMDVGQYHIGLVFRK